MDSKQSTGEIDLSRIPDDDPDRRVNGNLVRLWCTGPEHLLDKRQCLEILQFMREVTKINE